VLLGVHILRLLRRAGFLHDVGKILVPESILLKPSRLDDAEWEIMKQHPVVGERICQPLRSAAPLLSAIRHHHERLDGKGYPDGLRGDAISLHARILAVADSFDAMTSDRSYRKGMMWAEAAQVLQSGVGSQWDGEVVAVFLEWIRGRYESQKGSAPTAAEPI
jgi:putative two-component system response regulator